MMTLIMLVLLALPAFGVLTSMSRSLIASGQQSETEEVEERIPSSSQRRDEKVRSTCGGFSTLVVNNPSGSFSVAIGRPALDGHRIADGILAPMRC